MSAGASGSQPAAPGAGAPAVPQFPQGHLGHLSPKQLETFQSFKQFCQDKGTYTPPGKDGSLPSHEDTVMLRFLRARKFQVEPAYQQLISTDKWRKDNRIEELYDKIDVEEYDQTRKLYPQWVGRRDKRGFPVYVFEMGALDQDKVAAYEGAKTLEGLSQFTSRTGTPAKMLRLFALYEALTRMVSPWCTATPDRPYYPNTPITQGNNLIDVGGMGLRQFWALKSHLQDSSQLATAMYPETLDRIFIIGAPSFFPTIWSWVKRWFDPIVVSKMYILRSSEILSTLSESIDPANIPKKYGGQLDWKWGDMPVLDPAMTGLIEEGSMDDAAKGETEGQIRLLTRPVKWVKGEGGKMTAMAMGSEKGVQREKVLFRLKADWEKVFYPTAEGGEAATSAGPAKSGSGEGTSSPSGATNEAVDGQSTAATGTEEATVAQRGQLPSNGVVGVVRSKENETAGRASIDSQTPSIPTAAGPPVQA